MTAFKNSERDEILRIVLTENFKPRFAEIELKLRQTLQSTLASLHPKFCELVNEPTTRPYVAVTSCRAFYFTIGEDMHRFVAPYYGKVQGAPLDRYVERSADYFKIYDDSILTPISLTDLTISDKGLIKMYQKAWADYESASEKLKSLLQGYSTREGLKEAFPEFAKHLHALPVKSHPPVIIVKSVRAELAKVGIPKK